MLDYKIRTFMTLCKTMNYRVTAEMLNMSQPSVTQHIQLLEQYYDTKLFVYDKKKLYKTPSASLLEKHLATIINNEKYLEQELSKSKVKSIRIGATKTIGNYVINDKIIKLIKNNYVITFVIDNTKSLLQKLNDNELDLLIIEGVFNKNSYDYRLFRKEPFLGVCSKDHPFSKRCVSFEDIFEENLIIREKGSGTRLIFEQELIRNNYSLDSFKKVHCISNFELIKQLINNNLGITFAYQSIIQNSGLDTFDIENNKIVREFNYVCLKHTKIDELISTFENI
ncbi:MAG: LysR family transcriptional regulator [Sphaerochaetaceae bacterium]|nr:LysR family transcriptional regulator [Sphaerochaetaceae bacterium]